MIVIHRGNTKLFLGGWEHENDKHTPRCPAAFSLGPARASIFNDVPVAVRAGAGTGSTYRLRFIRGRAKMKFAVPSRVSMGRS